MTFQSSQAFRLGVFFLLLLVVLLAQSVNAAAQNRPQKLDVIKGAEKSTPKVLSANDVSTYKKMFQLQRALRRSDVVDLISSLDDKNMLMGHLIAERLLHRRTKVPYGDLKRWLARYHDHPQAWRIWRLANSRKPKGQRHRKPSISGVTSIAQYANPDAGKSVRGRPAPSRERRNKLRELRRYRVTSQYEKSVRALKKEEVRDLLGAKTHINVSLRVAQQMLNEGFFKQATELAQHVEKVSTANNPKSLWIQGLAHYQLRHFAKAGSLLRKMTMEISSKRSKYYTRAAYWAGRSYEELGRRSMAQVFYGMAAQSPLSFYGLLAHEELDTPPSLNWQKPFLDPAQLDDILSHQGVKRAVALVQIGEHKMAQREIKAAYSGIPYGYDESLLALALSLKLPAVSMTLARNLQEQGRTYLVGLFPDGVWQPLSDFRLDKSLLYAITRQESAFMPSIRSSAGARGLMQLMPGTAKHIRDINRRQRFATHQLYDPSVSMELGQEYLEYLDEEFSGNLLKMLAAYNAGPKNVEKWDERGITNGDPAMFIERIPFSETRKYVKAVMANLWMYRQYHYGHAPTMAFLADDVWPKRAKAYAQLKRSAAEKIQ